MEIKVGQWVRTNDNRIFEVYLFSERLNLVWAQCGGYKTDEIIKVANTPQGLVAVGDLVEFENHKGSRWCHIVNKVDGIYLRDIFGSYGTTDVVTAIYTPNEDKTQYTEQWRKANE